jgi:transcriptional regulator with XRE-family HTH domain
MDWNWETMRAHYLRLLQAAIDRGLTQGQIAVAGGLMKEQQNYISKIKHTRMQYGFKAEIFIRLIAGLGIPVSDFFAELEGRSPHVREHHDKSSTAPVSELERDLDRRVIVDAIIDTLQRGVEAPAQTSRLRRRKKH